jgi:CRP-like cAMP-binding protein
MDNLQRRQALAFLNTMKGNGAGADGDEIASVRPGEFFGESGLAAGRTTGLRAVAVADSTALLLAPDAVQRMFEASPALAREAGAAMEVRRRALQAARGGVGRHAAAT